MSKWGSALHAVKKYGYDDLAAPMGHDLVSLVSPVIHEVVDNTYPKQALGWADYEMAKGSGNDTAWTLVNKTLAANPIGQLTKGFLGDSSRDEILAAHDEGGGRGVYDQQQSTNNLIGKATNALLYDPLTYLGAEGSAGKVADLGLEGTMRVLGGEKVAGRTMQAVAHVAMPIAKVGEAQAKATEYVAANTVGRLAKSTVGGWITGLSERETVRQSLDKGWQYVKQSGILSHTAASSGVSEEAGIYAGRGAIVNRLQSVKDASGKGWQVVDKDGKSIDGVVYPQRLHADNEISKIMRTSGTTPKVLSRNDIVKLSSHAFEKGKAFDPKVVGDKVFERGNFAGQDVSSALGDIDRIVRNERAELDKMGMVFNKSTDQKDIDAALKKLTPAETARLGEIQQQWGKLGIDPITATDKERFAAGVGHVLDSDPTVAAGDDTLNAWLWDKPLKSSDKVGSSYGAALQDWTKEFLNDHDALVKKVGSSGWGPDAKEGFVKAVMGDGEEAKLYRKWREYGDIDLLHTPADQAAFSRLSKSVYADNGIMSRPKSTWWSDLQTIWKAQALLSPRYHEANISSAWFNNLLVNGTAGIASPQDFWAEIKHAWKADPSTFAIYGNSTLNDTIDKFDLGAPLTNVAHSGLANRTSNSEKAAARLFSKINMENFGANLGKIAERNRRVGAGIDTASRGRLWDTKFQAFVESKIPGFEAEVRDYGMKKGVAIPEDVAVVPFRSSKKLLGYYKGIGFTDGQAEHLSRSYANIVREGQDDALKLVQKTFFSYYKSNADELLSRVMPFHYYASRATTLYTEEMMRNPVLLTNFARLAEEMYGSYDNAGLSARQKGWLHVMSGPAGYTFLANPDALFGFTKTMGLMGDGYKSDQTQLGGILNYMKSAGLGLYPVYDNLFNALGTYGNTFEPDFLGIRHRALIGATFNELAAEPLVSKLSGGHFHGSGGMTPAPYAKINAEFRQFVSAEASKYLPGWMSTSVPAQNNSSGTIGQTSMDGMIESRIVSNNPGLTNQDLFELMNNPDSDEYQKAWTEVARTGVANQFMSFFLPVSVKLRDSKRDVRNAQLGLTYEMVNKYGISPDLVNPATDAKFAAAYKLQTGSDWKPGDFDKASFQTELIKATPQGRAFVMKDAQFTSLGSDLGRRIFREYNKISHGEEVPAGFTKPVPGNEQAVADAWLYKQGPAARAAYNELVGLRGAFKDANPDYGQYKDWQGKMGTLKTYLGGSLSLYREQVSKANPNAKRYFDNETQKIIKKYKDPQKRIEELDRATTSQEAWMAVTGFAPKTSDPRPLATATASAPANTQTDQMLSDFSPYGNSGQQQTSNPGGFSSIHF